MPGFSTENARRGCAVAAEVNRQARQQHDASVLPVILKLRAEGMSLTDIGHELMARGYSPRRGTYWHKRQLYWSYSSFSCSFLLLWTSAVLVRLQPLTVTKRRHGRQTFPVSSALPLTMRWPSGRKQTLCSRPMRESATGSVRAGWSDRGAAAHWAEKGRRATRSVRVCY